LAFTSKQLSEKNLGKPIYEKEMLAILHAILQTSLKAKQCQKLAPKFYGPYTVLKCVGQVAYQLALPSQSKLHPVFHVSCLKKVIGTRCQIQTNLPELAEEGSIWLQPEAVLNQRECRLHQRTIKEVLVQWKDMTPADATWEPATILQ
jgi:hypothetical protein